VAGGPVEVPTPPSPTPKKGPNDPHPPAKVVF
jgi:hypothetical protein